MFEEDTPLDIYGDGGDDAKPIMDEFGNLMDPNEIAAKESKEESEDEDDEETSDDADDTSEE